MPASSSGSVPSHDQALRFVARVHGLRTLGLGLGAIAVGSVLYRIGASVPVWALLALNGFAWPHLARWLAARSAAPMQTERRSLLIDSMMGGVWVALMRFDLLPSLALVTMLAMDKISVGGGRLLVRGLALQVAACVATAALNGFAFAPATSLAEIVATAPFLFLYPVAIATVLNRLTQRIRQQNRLLARLSRIDGLSELLNRGHWEEALAAQLERHRAQGRPISLLMIDVDHFKRINDRHGHLVGDEVIGRIGAIIRRSLRDGDLAGRYGGDEFGVVLPGADGTTAAAVAERIRAGVASARFEQADLCCTLSIGLAEAHPRIRDVRDWIQQADAALYQAKLEGRNRLALAATERAPEAKEACLAG